MSTSDPLRTVVRAHGQNQALRDGTVPLPGRELAFENVPVLTHAFRRMVRELAYDVCELAVTTYLCAREHGIAITAIPVFPARGLHHSAIVHNVRAGISGPGDLAGRRVGVSRGWTVTTGVWVRGILAERYGVDVDAVQWLLSGDEHVEAFVPPENVRPLPTGADLAEMLVVGELDAAIGVDVEHPDVKPLIPDADVVALADLMETGLYPINHLVAVRDDVLAADPGLAGRLLTAFKEAKDRYVRDLAAAPEGGSGDSFYRAILDATGSDPLPFGLDANRDVLERLVVHARAQHILGTPVSLDSLFAAT